MARARGLLEDMATANARRIPEIPQATNFTSDGARRAQQIAPAGAPASHLKLVPPIPTDAELVARTLDGGALAAEAQDELYRRYRTAVQRLATTFSELDADEVEDVVQEAFVRAFRALSGLKDPDRFAAWLFTIARNRARSYLTARATHEKAAEDACRESRLAEDCVPAANVVLEREAELRAVREVIESLREGPEKETVRLFYLDGTLSAREIAQRMGVGKSAVTMRLERFRARVRRELCDKLEGTA